MVFDTRGRLVHQEVLATESNMHKVEQDSEHAMDSVIGSQNKSFPRRSSAKLIGDGYSNKQASVIDS